MYLDTSTAAKLYLPEPESDAVQRLVNGKGALRSSELLIPEFASVLARKRRQGELSAAAQRDVWTLFEEHLAGGRWSLLRLTPQDFRHAAEILFECQEAAPLRTLDALHLAICRVYRVFPLCTTDQVMQHAADFLEIPIATV
jgi:predicted nucleic acid-binding protein